MRTKVELSGQVLEFVRSLAPEPRKSLRSGLRGLEGGTGDIQELEGDLVGWCRLRLSSHRVVFRYGLERGHRIARCEFAERRAVIYELFTEQIRRQIEGGES